MHPRRPPTARSIDTLRKSYPREAKYYKPGTRVGKRPQLVWERLWTTTNGDYGNKQFIEIRPLTKGQRRNEVWKNRTSDTTYKEYGQEKKAGGISTTPKSENVAEAEELSKVQEPQGSDSEKAPSLGPGMGSRASSVRSTESVIAPVRLSPIEKSGFPTGNWPINNEYILSGGTWNTEWDDTGTPWEHPISSVNFFVCVLNWNAQKQFTELPTGCRSKRFSTTVKISFSLLRQIFGIHRFTVLTM